MRYNEIATFLNLPTNDFYKEIKLETEPLHIKSTFVPKKIKQEDVVSDESTFKQAFNTHKYFI